MHKKGQLTYFILLSVIIFIAAGFVFYVNGRNKTKELEMSFDVSPITNFIESCVRDEGENAVIFISEHGGYYNLPSNHYEKFGLSIPYYFYGNIPFNPTKEEI